MLCTTFCSFQDCDCDVHSYNVRDVHSYNTRSKNSFRLPYCRTNVRKFSFRFRGPKIFNSLSSEIQNAFSICFFICFIIKNLLISPRIRVIFKTNFNFQTNRGGVSVHLYSHKARLFQPITTPVRMLQMI